jgi:mono/diheme cytochrome c family protein
LLVRCAVRDLFRWWAIVGTATFAVVTGARAGEDAIQLKEGPGREVVETRCVACHSLDYIQMNSPFPGRKGWEASVGKMVRVMGAPLTEEEMRTVVDYLTAHYGQ